MKSRVVIPAESGRWFAEARTTSRSHCHNMTVSYSRMLLTEGHIALSITSTQVPPMLACTPYQILA